MEENSRVFAATFPRKNAKKVARKERRPLLSRETSEIEPKEETGRRSFVSMSDLIREDSCTHLKLEARPGLRRSTQPTTIAFFDTEMRKNTTFVPFVTN